MRLGALAAAVAALAIAAVIVYNSSLFTIESVSVSGADHLTASDMQQLAGCQDVEQRICRIESDAHGTSVMSRDGFGKTDWVWPDIPPVSKGLGSRVFCSTPPFYSGKPAVPIPDRDADIAT